MTGGYPPSSSGSIAATARAMTAMPASWTTREGHRTGAVNVEQLSADRSPQQADDDEQDAGRPDVAERISSAGTAAASHRFTLSRANTL